LIAGEAAVRLADDGTEIALDGPSYLNVLARLHEQLRPRTYLEVGAWKGASLRLSSCASLAVDLDFQLEEGVVGRKPLLALHQSTSDSFFQHYDPTDILGGRVDFAFIDALHIFENVLRDFMGTERSCRPEAAIAIDDVCPLDFFMARATLVPDRPQPTKHEGAWTGDVWKIVPVLREYRPDIELVCLDARPAGLAVCTRLNPEDHTLRDKYDEIIDRWRDVKLEEYGMTRLLDDLGMRASENWVAALSPLHPEDPAPAAPPPRPVPPPDPELAVLRAELDALLSSRSWRLTGPVRAAARIVRSTRGGSGV
jgi:hypothetical protein